MKNQCKSGYQLVKCISWYPFFLEEIAIFRDKNEYTSNLDGNIWRIYEEYKKESTFSLECAIIGWYKQLLTIYQGAIIMATKRQMKKQETKLAMGKTAESVKEKVE